MPIKKYNIHIFAIILAVFMLSSVCLARTQRRDQEFGQADGSRSKRSKADSKKQALARQGGEDIDNQLQVMLEKVNKAAFLSPTDIELSQAALKRNKKFMSKFDDDQKSRYHTLGAWTGFYAGEIAKSVSQAKKAKKMNSQDTNASITHAAISILQKDFKTTATLFKKEQNSNSLSGDSRSSRSSRRNSSQKKSRRNRSSSRSARSSVTETLKLDLEAVKGGLLGKKIGSMRFKCLNGSKFSWETDKGMLCVLLWKLEYDNSETESNRNRDTQNERRNRDMQNERRNRDMENEMMAMDHTGMPNPELMIQQNTRRSSRSRSRQTSTPDEQIDVFSEMFIGQFDNPKVKFLAINLDDTAQPQEVLEKLLESPGPWAQTTTATLPDETTNILNAVNINAPTLMVVDSEGTICYAGPGAGFLAKMVLEYRMTQMGDYTAADDSEDDFDIAPAIATVPDKKTVDSIETTPPQVDDDEDEIVNIQAEKLLSHAKSFFKIGARMRSFKQPVDMCRQVIRDYPDTKHADEARQLLRQVPKRFRKRYNLTDEEMGL